MAQVIQRTLRDSVGNFDADDLDQALGPIPRELPVNLDTWQDPAAKVVEALTEPPGEFVVIPPGTGTILQPATKPEPCTHPITRRIGNACGQCGKDLK